MADTVNVTQADATFVADILELAETLELAGNDLASIRNGIWNDEPSDLGRLLRMAAKHRIATPPAPNDDLRAALERAGRNAEVKHGEVVLHASDWLAIQDALTQENRRG